MATRNPVNSPVDMIEYPIIYRVLWIPGGEHQISEPSTVGFQV